MNRALRVISSVLVSTWAVVTLAALHGGCTGTVLTPANGSLRDAKADVEAAGCASPADCPAGQVCDTTRHVCAYECSSSTDCAIGEACDRTTHACTMSCSPGESCNGACCNGGTCTDCAGTSAGVLCLAASGGQFCGCNSENDCPAGEACNSYSHTCAAWCSTTRTCHGGCCYGGTCTDCAGTGTGSLCLTAEGGAELCGCTTANDCPTGTACDVSSHACTTVCSEAQPCHGGCCNGHACVSGTTEKECGNSSDWACVSCAKSASGSACVPGGTCGCASASDCAKSSSGPECLTTGLCGCTRRTECPDFEACAGGACSTKCSSTEPCNGGCCFLGACVSGTAQRQCGGTGLACFSCAASAAGTACLPSGVCGCTSTADCATRAAGSVCMLGHVCGCAAANDCPEGQACDTAKHACTTACSATQTCRGGCCSSSTGGTCEAGTSDGACGETGVCADCSATCATGGTCSCSPTNGCRPGVTFAYTGASQTLVIPAGVTEVTVDADGAQGGSGSEGQGGWTIATVPVTPGETLWVFVGGDGSSGGFNGGGVGSGSCGGSGGGASDLREGGSALANRIVVAGGGGGGVGGVGGNKTGGSGHTAPGASGSPGGGGTQSAGGSPGGTLGDGGSGANGGGGGYYGGGAGSGSCCSKCKPPRGPGGGGGGSSYVEPTATTVSMSAGVWSGNGQVRITW